MGRVHRGEVRVSRESPEGCWLRYLKARKPYLENGSWRDYRRQGELRILPPGSNLLPPMPSSTISTSACSGPRGLVDRVEALDGRLDLDSPTGAAMCIRAEIPCGEREHQPRGR
jgi:hypothetical protein